MPRIIQSKVTRIQIVSVEVTWSDEDTPTAGPLELTAGDVRDGSGAPPGARKPRKKSTRPVKPPAKEPDG